MNYNEIFPKIISHAKEYGFIFPSSEIYDGLGAVYDYGQLGVELKNNIKTAWWKAMVQMHENIVGLDAAILMHPTTWKASGHVDAFNDPLIDNKDSKKRYRADVLIEEEIQKYLDKSLKDTNKRAKKLIIDTGIADPASGSKNWSEVRQFNLMFHTQLGATADSALDLYLRPETAQGIFVNYLNVQKTSRSKLPFGIAQIGKAFRNEIVARQFIFRMREFEQMEMQYFIKPGTQQKWYEYWKEHRRNWHMALGLSPEKLSFHEH
ncbi:UNVERIFIED_CONTAM: hypothetical protein GTU68_029407, partial [Idotea baltica]|nr:hypothetical protein [Idotea baltica]